MYPRVQVFPRKKAGQSTRSNPLFLSESDISSLFHMKQAEAANHLGLSVTALKNACRKLGIMKWPYQKDKTDDCETSSNDDVAVHGLGEPVPMATMISSQQHLSWEMQSVGGSQQPASNRSIFHFQASSSFPKYELGERCGTEQVVPPNLVDPIQPQFMAPSFIPEMSSFPATMMGATENYQHEGYGMMQGMWQANHSQSWHVCFLMGVRCWSSFWLHDKSRLTDIRWK